MVGAIKPCRRFGGIPHAAPRHFRFHDETSIEAVTDVSIGAAKAEGSAIGTFKGIQLQASLESTAEAIVADYNRRITLLDQPASHGGPCSRDKP
jgi:hypothetical protein